MDFIYHCVFGKLFRYAMGFIRDFKPVDEAFNLVMQITYDNITWSCTLWCRVLLVTMLQYWEISHSRINTVQYIAVLFSWALDVIGKTLQLMEIQD